MVSWWRFLAFSVALRSRGRDVGVGACLGLSVGTGASLNTGVGLGAGVGAGVGASVGVGVGTGVGLEVRVGLGAVAFAVKFVVGDSVGLVHSGVSISMSSEMPETIFPSSVIGVAHSNPLGVPREKWSSMPRCGPAAGLQPGPGAIFGFKPSAELFPA